MPGYQLQRKGRWCTEYMRISAWRLETVRTMALFDYPGIVSTIKGKTQGVSHNKWQKHARVERIFENKPEWRWKLRWLECIKNELCAMEDRRWRRKRQQWYWMTLQGRTLAPRTERLNWQWESSSVSSYLEGQK